MNAATRTKLERRLSQLHNLPAMPSILQSLSECLGTDPSNANVDKVVELISYDKSLTAQCLKVANSALFTRRRNVESVHGAVMALGLYRVRNIVYSCNLPGLFSKVHDGMAQNTFWRHALGTALVSQHLAQRFSIPGGEKLYLAGLLHDMGILVNALLFGSEFHSALQIAETSETPLCEVETRVLGFTHCDSGRMLADLWKLPLDITAAIELHHRPQTEGADMETTCVVYLADLLCRLRGLGYGYYEARAFDLVAEPAWQALQAKYPAVSELDLARFTFELDEYAVKVQELVDSIFAREGVRQ